MKLRFTFVALTAISAALGTVPLLAQSGVIQADVPFEFVVGSQTIPEGRYIFDRPAQNVARIMSQGGGRTAFELVERGSLPLAARDGEIKLIFHRYGKIYFLAEIRDGYNGSEFLFQQTKTEKELLRGTASLRAPEEAVTVLARLN